MKPSTYTPVGFEQLTSTGTADIKTATVPSGASAVLVTVETTNARMTLTGDAPAATEGHVVPKDQNPLLLVVGLGTTIKHASTAAAASVLNLTYLR